LLTGGRAEGDSFSSNPLHHQHYPHDQALPLERAPPPPPLLLSPLLLLLLLVLLLLLLRWLLLLLPCAVSSLQE
jgi:hypothetical protein